MTNVEVEGDLEIVELYQFELVASDLSNTEAKDDSGDKERLSSKDWYEFACMTITDNLGVLQKVHYCGCQCRNCMIMPTNHEFICCCEVVTKKEESSSKISGIANR